MAKVEVTDLKAPNAANDTVADATDVQVKLWIDKEDVDAPDVLETDQTITGGVLSVPLYSESELVTELYGATEDGLMFRFGPDTCYTDTARTTPAAVGDAVAGVDELSGNGYHATQSNSLYRPILRQDANGKYYLEFDGADDHLVVGGAANMTRNIGYITMAAGAKITNTADIGAIFYASGAEGDNNTRSSIRLNIANQEFGVGGRRLDSDSLTYLTTTAPTGNFSTVSYIDYANALAEVRINKTSAVGPSAFLTAGSTSDTASNIVSVGSVGTTTSSNFNGNIYSVVVVTRELTAQELIDVENYLYYTTGQILYDVGSSVLGVAKWTVTGDDYFFPIDTTVEAV